MKDYIEECAINIANYIIGNSATVRQTAKEFGISKSTVHMVATKWNGLCGKSNEKNPDSKCIESGFYFISLIN